MKKLIILSALVLTSLPLFSQEEKISPYVTLQYFKTNGDTSYIKTILTYTKDRIERPIPGLKITMYSGDATGKLLSEATTDEKGIVKCDLSRAGLKKDENGFWQFSASFEGNDTIEASSAELLIRDASLAMTGIVLVDNERCIGCKFCMTGCPYSVRVFNWKDPEVDLPKDTPYNPETNIPPVEGTVGKCVFCADKLRLGELPRCVTACPMGVLYFGDLLEDTVTNGTETIRFSKLMADRAGYRFREELGTLPNVFYLPPASRSFTVESGLEGYEEDITGRYKNAGPR